ncbi:aldo/keto reductase [Halalkalicoccus ordinarius]|uniref:aldo/keto reductase n=1 Tax=Halalkalicoccus ordinarius TaxID=3116651 RepID=UPI00300F34FD
MEYVRVQDVEIPALGLGTWNLTDDQCVRTVGRALELGYRHVDTAQDYGNEREVGRAIATADVPREECFVTTKLWPSNYRYDDAVESTRESLDRLGLEYVDLLLMHWPSLHVPTEETLGAMADLVDEGLVRHVGVSNFSRSRLEEARELSRVPILADQVQYHPYRDRSDLLEYCRQEGIVLTAYSPLVHGGLVDDERLAAIGERYGKTAAQVALRWLVQQEPVAAIPKASSREHLAANIAVFDFSLTDEEMAEVADPSALRTGLGWMRGRFGRRV